MTWLARYAEDPTVARIGTALFHSLWQGILVSVATYIAMTAIPRSSPNLRYAALVGTFFILLALPVVSFWTNDPAPLPHPAAVVEAPSLSAPFGEAYGPAEEQDAPDAWSQTQNGSLSTLAGTLSTRSGWLTIGWACGVLLLTVRLIGSVLAVSRLERSGVPLARSFELLTSTLRDVGLRKPVRLLTSTRTQVPSVIGWWKPVILLPACAVSRLSPQQLEAIVIHELIHIRRHDYLINFVQVVGETVLFFHPAIWYISRRLRIEREYCCDAAAAKLCPSHIEYARALLETEVSRASPPRLGIAATAGHLKRRIFHLLEVPIHRADPSACRWGAAALLVAVTGGVLWAKLAEDPVATLAIQRGGEASLSVQVRNATTGEPISGSRVASWHVGGDARAARETDANGRIQIAYPETASAVFFTARHPQFVPRMLTLERKLPKPIPTQVLISLEPAVTVGGTVTSPEGIPLAGAQVSLSVIHPRGPSAAHIVESTVVCDTGGRWRFSEFPSWTESVRIRFDHPEFDARVEEITEAPPLATLKRQAHECQLQRGRALSGRVIDASGNGIANAQIRSVTQPILFPDGHCIGLSAPAISDRRGRFSLTAPTQRNLLQIEKTGFAPELVFLESNAEESSVAAIRLEAARQIRGTVMAGDDPLPGAFVNLVRWRNQCSLRRACLTDADGRFILNDAPTDAIVVRVTHPAYARAREVQFAAHVSEFQVELTTEGEPKVLAFDLEDGQTIRGAAASWPGDRSAEPSPPSARGHTISISANGYHPERVRIPPLPGEPVALRVGLRRSPNVGGVVLSPAGERLEGADLYWFHSKKSARLEDGQMSEDCEPNRVGASSEDGSFVISDPATQGTLVAVHASGVSTLRTPLADGEVTLKLQRWGRVEIHGLSTESFDPAEIRLGATVEDGRMYARAGVSLGSGNAQLPVSIAAIPSPSATLTLAREAALLGVPVRSGQTHRVFLRPHNAHGRFALTSAAGHQREGRLRVESLGDRDENVSPEQTRFVAHFEATSETLFRVWLPWEGRYRISGSLYEVGSRKRPAAFTAVWVDHDFEVPTTGSNSSNSTDLGTLLLQRAKVPRVGARFPSLPAGVGMSSLLGTDGQFVLLYLWDLSSPRSLSLFKELALLRDWSEAERRNGHRTVALTGICVGPALRAPFGWSSPLPERQYFAGDDVADPVRRVLGAFLPGDSILIAPNGEVRAVNDSIRSIRTIVQQELRKP